MIEHERSHSARHSATRSFDRADVFFQTVGFAPVSSALLIAPIGAVDAGFLRHVTLLDADIAALHDRMWADFSMGRCA